MEVARTERRVVENSPEQRDVGFDPADVPWHGDQRPFGGHAGGMHAAMADGSVRFLRSSIEPQNLAAALTIAGGEPVNLD